MHCFSDLRAAVAAAAACLALAPAAAQAADIETPVAAYDFASQLAPSAGDQPLAELGTTTVATFDFDGSGPKPARNVRSFDAGEGFSLNPDGLQDADAYGIVFYVRLASVTGAVRLLDVTDGTSDAGLYAVDGNLVLRRAGTSDVVGDGSESIEAGEWVQVAFGNDGGATRAWIDGVAELTDPDGAAEGVRADGPIRFFADDGSDESAGDVARIRLFDGALTDADVVDVDELDETAPFLDVWSPWDFTDRTPDFEGEVADSGTRFPSVTLELRRNGTTIHGPHPIAGTEADTMFFFEWPSFAPLQDGGGYEAIISAADRAGNVTREVRSFTVDGGAPTGLSLAGTPASTDDTTPRIAGGVPLVANDEPYVYVDVYRGAGTDHDQLVASLELPVSGGAFGGDVPNPLPLGDYTVRAYHYDAAYNWQAVSQALRITAPPVVIPPPSPGPPAPPVALPQPPTAGALAAELLTSALSDLRREGLRGLADGVLVRFTARRPGTAVVQLWAGSAPKKVDATARAAAKKRAKRKKAKGNLLAVGRRVFRAPGPGAIKVALTKKGRKSLRGKRSAKITVRTIFVPVGGAPVAVDRRLVLKR